MRVLLPPPRLGSRLFRKQKPRQIQLAAAHFGRVWSRFLFRYHHFPDHPAKLRILGILERLTGSRRIIAPTVLGFDMALDRTDFVQRTIFTEGIYEPEVTRVLMSELRPRDVFFDVGANAGYYTCAAVRIGVKLVCAFEPDPLAASVVRLNLGLNGADPKTWRVLELALGRSVGTAIFHRSHVSNSGRSGLRAVDAVASFRVPVDTVDSIIADGRAPLPTVMKVDVEGHELEVLLGARRLLEDKAPRLIVFEAERDLLSDHEHPLTRLLHSKGYSIEHLARLSGVIEDVENYAARRLRSDA